MIEKTVREASLYTVRKPTNFYPLYNSANDQVDRVTGVSPVGFQAVLPRYRLSTSETRDLGTGPDIETEVYTSYRKAAPRTKTITAKSPLPPEKGQTIDMYI
jgi:hypothetical protein